MRIASRILIAAGAVSVVAIAAVLGAGPVMTLLADDPAAARASAWQSLGAAQDPVQRQDALAALAAAGEAGDPEAWHLLGRAYAEGRLVDRDVDRAVSFYQKAGALGSDRSLVAAGVLLAREEEPVGDPGLAAALLEEAVAIERSGPALKLLGDLAARQGTAEADAQARDYYVEAAGAGDDWAKLAYAQMLLSGRGEAADPARAVQLLQEASDAGNVRAMRLLGATLRASGTPSEALAAYRRAAEEGDPPAMLALGTMLGAGEGTAADPAGAIDWLEKAVQQGATQGWRQLGDMYLADSGRQDFAAARDAYRQAGEAGDSWGYLRLGDMLAASRFGMRDLEGARRAYSAGAALGNESAAAKLSALDSTRRADASESIAPELRIDTSVTNALPPPDERSRLELAADIQRMLVTRGYQPGPVDGDIGRRTELAMAQFCADAGLADCADARSDMARLRAVERALAAAGE